MNTSYGKKKTPIPAHTKRCLRMSHSALLRTLGLDRAEDEDLCLDCHADNVPVERRAKGFQISDGVGCEACHGGAVNWLGRHISGEADHAANLASGLVPK